MTKSAGAAVAAAAALLVVAAPAGAATQHRSHQKADAARIAQLTRANRRLQKQLRNMTILRNNGKAALATANGQISGLQAQISSLQAQNAGLQAQVASLTKARDAALAQVAALQAQIATVPKPLAVAVQQVRREVAYAEKYGGGVPYAHGRLVAQAAMDYVVEHVSPTAYGYLEIFGGQLPASNPDAVLGAQAGLCGGAALVFAAIVKRLGLGARSVQFYYDDPDSTPDSHIAVEVSYDSGWHYFDPTFGVFFTDGTGNALSITDARAGSGTEQKDELAFTNLVENTFYGDDTWFETDPTTVVDIDKQPFTG